MANRFLFFIALVSLLPACAGKQLDRYVEQFDHYDNTAYVIDHGIHTAVVVDAIPLATRLGLADSFFSRYNYIEIGRGDAGFYQEQEAALSTTLKALFLSSPAVLHLSAYNVLPEKKFPLSKAVEIRLSRNALEKLLDAIASDFKMQDGVAIELAQGRDASSRFFESKGSYHLFYTCNNWTADVIQQADYPIRHRWSFFSSSVMKQLDQVQRRLHPVQNSSLAKSQPSGSRVNHYAGVDQR
ncbi:MAG: hypothetical protein ACI9KN_001950 [Gammaproteobacteria bacterium]|jgi:uncharacterized protein (TIGR02117 family)